MVDRCGKPGAIFAGFARRAAAVVSLPASAAQRAWSGVVRRFVSVSGIRMRSPNPPRAERRGVAWCGRISESAAELFRDRSHRAADDVADFTARKDCARNAVQGLQRAKFTAETARGRRALLAGSRQQQQQSNHTTPWLRKLRSPRRRRPRLLRRRRPVRRSSSFAGSENWGAPLKGAARRNFPKAEETGRRRGETGKRPRGAAEIS